MTMDCYLNMRYLQSLTSPLNSNLTTKNSSQIRDHSKLCTLNRTHLSALPRFYPESKGSRKPLLESFDYVTREYSINCNPASDSLTSLYGGMLGQVPKDWFPFLDKLITKTRKYLNVKFTTGHGL